MKEVHDYSLNGELMPWLRRHSKALGALVVSVAATAALALIGPHYGWWQAGVAVLSIAIIATIGPIPYSFLEYGELNPPGDWFDTAGQLGTQKDRAQQHYTRIAGTLRFWKNKAAAHYRLHLSRVIWSLGSAVILPVLIQYSDQENGWSVLFMTILTTFTGLIVALAYTFKSEERYQGLRQQESDFYDLSRKLLDTTMATDPDLIEKVNAYIEVVAKVRAVGRRVETGSPPSAL